MTRRSDSFVLMLLMAVALMAGCGKGSLLPQLGEDGRGLPRALVLADSLMNSRPDSALAVLEGAEGEMAGEPKSVRMRYQLLRHQAMNKAFVPFTSDSLMLDVADYYDSHGTTNDRMLAHYLLGCVYRDMKDAPKAMDCFLDATEFADTTVSNCDYSILATIYAQMSDIFHKQCLPYDEIQALRKYIQCIWKTGNHKQSIIAQGYLVNPYYLLGEKDTVLQIINTNYNELKSLGHSKEAARTLGTAIYIYTERKKLEKARQLISIYEKESELFDAEGNIAKGRESYYWIKGFYELAVGHVDTAEFLFKKAASNGNASDISNAYKGLLAVYQHKHIIDSVLHYSQLNESTLDSLHNQIQTEAIHQMSSLYDYTCSRKEVEKESEKKRYAWYCFWAFFALVSVLSGVLFHFYLVKQKEKQTKMAILNKELITIKGEQQAVQKELKRLKDKNYENLIEEKEKKERELIQRISELEKGNDDLGSYSLNNSLDDFKNSQIVDIFEKKAQFTIDHPIPNKWEWNALVKQFKKDLPSVYATFQQGKKLSPLELHTCILLILDYEEGIIVGLTKTSSQAVSIAKGRANMKLFKEKGAVSLKNNLDNLVECF